jgi:hypothetical protein
MEAVNRRHLANMRVVQKNLVYVIGLHPKYAVEEVGLLLYRTYPQTLIHALYRSFDQMITLDSLAKSSRWWSTNGALQWHLM